MLVSQQLQYQFLPIWIGTAVVIILAILLMYFEFDFAGPVVGVIAVIGIIVSVLICLPFQSKYMIIDHIRGTVSSTNATSHGFTTVGDGTAVMQLNDKSQQYQMDDTRLLTYKVGQTVKLSCTLQWNPGSQDQYNCGLDK